MKVALVGPELEENLALRYLHAALSNAGHECRIFDFHLRHQIDSISADIVSFSPGLIGLSMVFTARAQEFVDMAEILKQKYRFRGHITAGGHFASFHAEQLLLSFNSIDTVIHGEGEQAIVDLANNIDTPQIIYNISYRNPDKKIIRTKHLTNKPDLDSLAWPTRTLPLHTYFNLPIANIVGGRGCFGSCSFCSIAAWHRENGGLRYRFRSPEDIGKEMAYLYHDCGARIFNFHDDNFFYPHEKDSIDRFRKLGKFLKKERIEQIAIQIKARPDSISQPVVDILKQLGLFRVFLGIENNAVSGLKALGRGITRECNHTALKILQKNNIHTTFNLLMFEPDMTPDDLLDNIAMIKEHPGFPLNFGRVEVYSGTPLEQRLRKDARLSGNIFGYTYTIKNREMQTAFELFKKVFWGRNFEAEGMNHLSMRADYYYHLLKHFYPSLITKELSGSIKESIANLNRNSANLLLSIHEFVTNNSNLRQESIDQFGLELLAWRKKYDTGARNEFLNLIKGIESSVSEYHQSRLQIVPGMVAAAAAVVIAVTSMNCDSIMGHDWHVSEMMAVPFDSTDWETAAMLPQYEADAIGNEIYSRHKDTLRTLAQTYGFVDKQIQVDLMIGGNGCIIANRTRVPVTANSDTFSNALNALFPEMMFSGIQHQGKCIINVTVKDVPYPPSYIRQDTTDLIMWDPIPEPLDSSDAKPIDLTLTEIVWNDSLWSEYPEIDSQIVKAINQKIDSTYYEEISNIIGLNFQKTESVHIDMILDAVGAVTMFRVYLIDETIEPAVKKKLIQPIQNWHFPFVKTLSGHPGKCSVELIIPYWETHYSEMIPFPQ